MAQNAVKRKKKKRWKKNEKNKEGGVELEL